MDAQQPNDRKVTPEQEANLERHLRNQERPHRYRRARKGESGYRSLMNLLNGFYMLTLGLGLTGWAFMIMVGGGVIGLVPLLPGVVLTIAGIRSLKKRLTY